MKRLSAFFLHARYGKSHLLILICGIHGPHKARRSDAVHRKTPTPRATKKALMREALLSAGRRLFAAKSIDAISIDAVVQAAGVSKGSFYNYFADRQALVEAVVGDIRDDLHTMIAAANEHEVDAARRVARAACFFMRYAIDEPEGGGALARIHGNYVSPKATFNEPLVADLRHGLADGRFCIPTLDAGVLLVIGIVQVGLVNILQNKNPSLAISMSQQLVMMMLKGLGINSDEADLMAAQVADEVIGARSSEGATRRGGEGGSK